MIKQNSKTQNKTIYADSVAVATFDSTMQPDGQAQLSLSIIDPEKFHASEEAQNDFQGCVDSVTAESKQVMTDRSKFQKAGVIEEQAWREVLERLARIETKLDNYETVRDKAERALLIAQSNAKLIEKMEANNKWAWGFMLTLAVTVIGYIITKIL